MMILIIGSLFFFACSKETPDEKLQVKADKLERSIDQTVNRADEAICGSLTGDSKLECLAKKAKHRAVEGKEIFVDKTKEIKNKLDNE